MTPIDMLHGPAGPIALYRWGQDAQPVVLLVHGYPDNAGVWEPIATRLADSYCVYAYDVRGAGRSARPSKSGDYALSHLLRDLECVLDHISPHQPVHLVGHDWGSIQCWEAVCTERFQHRIAGYTSLSGLPLDYAGLQMRERALDAPTKALKQLASSWYIAAFQLPLLAPALWEAALGRLWPQLLEAAEGVRQQHQNDTQADDGRDGVQLYRANFLPKLLAPEARSTPVHTQVLVANRDRFVTPDLLDKLYQVAPKLTRYELNAGHWCILSHPGPIAATISRFVQTRERHMAG